MSKAERIVYRIKVESRKSGYDSGRRYEIYANDPAGEITKAVNDKTGCSFVVDFVAETITPSGYPTSTGRCRLYCVRFDLKPGEEIRKALAKFALKNDEFHKILGEQDHIVNWKEELKKIK